MIALILELQCNSYVPAQDVQLPLTTCTISSFEFHLNPFIISYYNISPQIVKKAMTYMEHDRRMEYRSKHLVFALEQFAEEVKQQQMLPEYLKDNAAAEEENESGGGEEEMEWKEDGEQEKEEGEEGTGECDADDDEAIQEIYDREQEELDAVRDLPTAVERDEAENNIFGYDVVLPNVATPQFDELFPPVASNSSTTHCLSRGILAKTWNDTGSRFYRSDLNVHGEDEDAFYGKLNDSLNAYVATMLLEPRSLDAAFANVDD